MPNGVVRPRVSQEIRTTRAVERSSKKPRFPACERSDQRLSKESYTFLYTGDSHIIKTMLSFTEEETEALTTLGERLRRRRLLAGDQQDRAAARIGVSAPTYRKLEQGDPTAQVGAWIRAIRLYGSLADLAALLPQSLFDDEPERQRAPKRQQ